MGLTLDTSSITGAGGYLQNFVYGYAGLRYTKYGLNLRPVLPPHSVKSMKLRGLSLAGSRMDVHFRKEGKRGEVSSDGMGNGDSVVVTITVTSSTTGLTVRSQGRPDTRILPSSAGAQFTTVVLCKTCGCDCPGGGCGCLSIVPS
eukprot:SAG31_NODE_14191_length_822_cov_1.275242_2_plen_145_part_00